MRHDKKLPLAPDLAAIFYGYQEREGTGGAMLWLLGHVRMITAKVAKLEEESVNLNRLVKRRLPRRSGSE